MGRGRGWGGGGHFALDAREMAAFVMAVERGATIGAAAREAGVAVSTLYYRRRVSLPFAQAWAEAAAKSARPMLVAASGGRKLVLRRGRPVKFDRARKQAFLDHFAGTCNLEAAAKAAGICVNSVYRALASDPAFAEGFEEALKAGYQLLEAEAVRQQREAQKKYRISPKGDPAAQAQSFERTLQLLREYKRPGGGVGRRAALRGDARSRWTFDEAMVALEKKLKNFGVEIGEEAPPPPCGRSPSPGNPGEDLDGPDA